MDRRKTQKSDRPAKNSCRLKISVFNQQKALPIAKASVSSVVKNFLTLEAVVCSELSIFFVDHSKIAQLHAQFFGDPSPTDCITFPIDADPLVPERYLGDLFIAPEAALIYAQKKELDPYEETTLYLVHGLLHLIGFKDGEPKDKRRMRAREKFHMRSLKERFLLLHKGHRA